MISVLVVRVVHVLLGAFWVGTVLFFALFLQPALGELGPAAGKFMEILQRRRYTQVLSMVGGLTVLTGIYLLWRVSGGFSPGYMGTRSGILLSSGGLSSIVALALGFMVSRPTAQKLGAIAGRVAASGAPPSAVDAAEIARLQRKLAVVLRTVVALLLIALVAMALGPHV